MEKKMHLTVIKSNEKHKYGSLTHEGIEYDLLIGHPENVLKDNRLSWESKGILSYILFISNDIDISDECIHDLMFSDYLVETK